MRDVKVKSSLGCNDHGMAEFRILGRGNTAKSSRITTLVQRCAWKNFTGYSSGEKRGPAELVDSPPSSETDQPNEQNIKQRWQEMSMDEKRALH